MNDRTLSRREILRGSVHLAIIGSVSMVLGGCSKTPLECTDISALDAADRQLRESLEYQDQSPLGKDKSCQSCEFFKPAGRNECGSCTLIQGPINPAGYCNSWAAKQA
jgi:hypothetical protein